jgi:prepilin-type N-terminal cleavage/methylation domain-containing protein
VRRAPQSAGFTLVELVVAMTLFALLLSVLMPALQQGLAGLGGTGQRRQALILAQALLNVHAVDPGQPLLDEPLRGESDGFEWEVQRDPYLEDELGLMDPELPVLPVRVSATVRWDDGRAQLVLSTLSLDPPAEQ